MSRLIHIRNFGLFTHYKKRRLRWNIWVKSDVSELNDLAFLELSLAQRGLLYQLRLLYAENREKGVEESRVARLLGLSPGDRRRMRGHLELLNDAGYILITDSEDAQSDADARGEPWF